MSLERIACKPKSRIIDIENDDSIIASDMGTILSRRWSARLCCGDPAPEFPLTLVAVHDWDNLKDDDGHSHFMIANAIFSRSEGRGLTVMSFVAQQPVPLSKATVLCDINGGFSWTVLLDFAPINSGEWSRVRGLSVDPLFCTRCIRARASNDIVSDLLRQRRSPEDGDIIERASQVDGMEAIVNPQRSLCLWFRPAADKRRSLVQIDVLVRATWFSDDYIICPIEDWEGRRNDAECVAAIQSEDDREERQRQTMVTEGAELAGEVEEEEEVDDNASTATAGSGIVVSKYTNTTRRTIRPRRQRRT